jgi:serine protease Do
MSKHPAAKADASAEPAWLPTPSPAFAKATGAGAVALADVAERVTPSVVSISATKVETTRGQATPFQNPFFEHFFGPNSQMPREHRAKGLGSGVIVSADGIVLTNHHVVDKAEEITVQTADEREFEAKVVGSDAKSDLAVLRLQGDVKGLRPLPLGDSSRLRLGEVVLAVGNPFGIGQTVTMGIVSAKGRADVGIVDYEDFIQTDAAINPGNSGGALVSMEGKLVGINTAIVSRSGGYQGIGFAIPSNMARPIMDSLLKSGKVVRGWLGVGIQDIDKDLADGLGLESTHGVLVSDLQDDSPAKRAGLKRGDVILSVDGKQTDSTGKLRNLIAAAGANKKVRVEVLREGKKQNIAVELGELPGSSGPAVGAAPEQGLSGLLLEPLSKANRAQFEIPDEIRSGVVVKSATPNGSAGRVLRPGDVILEVDKKPVSSPEAFEAAYQKSKGRVLLLVHRGNNTIFLTLQK